jgi:hypothetical protein
VSKDILIWKRSFDHIWVHSEIIERNPCNVRIQSRVIRNQDMDIKFRICYKIHLRDWSCISVVEHFLSMCEALGSIPITTKQQQKTKQNKKKRDLIFNSFSQKQSPLPMLTWSDRWAWISGKYFFKQVQLLVNLK